jgi:NADPH-dependent glutamate synthase beta subunit-like oxidoreductase/Pyruvate/2-oxoacid:ferredoxin oxidoreductase delta subunit
VGIRYLKCLAADIEREQGRIKPDAIPKKHNEKVSIVGAGPAGLSCAYELAKLGYPVTVFERMPSPGGMMRWGIPDYRLQKYVVINEISYIQDLGVEIKTGVEFGKKVSIDTLKNEGYKAFFIAVGAQLSQRLGVLGEELEGVYPAVEFLRHIALGETPNIGEKIAVIGGGNTAIDAARTALRLGAKRVMILYRRSRDEMPALPAEIEAAEEEGVQFNFLVAPKQIIGEDGKVRAIECLRMKFGEPDESRRRRPIPIPRSEHTYDVDAVIPAIGQQLDTSCLPQALLDKSNHAISTDSLTLETQIPGIFAGGDAVTGPASVIEAVGAGRRAAESIHRYLSGEDLRAGREQPIEETTWIKDWEQIAKKPERYTLSHVDVGRQKVSFREAEECLVKIKKLAMSEAHRCLACGPCSECLEKEELCEADKAVVEEASCTGCNVCALNCSFDAIQKNERGIAQVNEALCKGCGVCAASCPERAVSMKKCSDMQLIASVEAALARELV